MADKSSVIVGLLLATTFGAGLAAGVAADRLWLRPEASVAAADSERRAESRPSGGEEGGEGKKKDSTVIKRFSEELGLTASQEAKIDTILRHFRHRMKELRREVKPRYEAVVDSARSEIDDVLTEEQADRYRELLRRERKKDEDDDRASSGHKGGKRDV